MGKLLLRVVQTVLSLVLVLSCVSCGRARLPADYRMAAFDARVSWTVEGLSVLAVLRADAPVEGARGIRMEMISPQTLSGVVLTRQEGQWRVACGELETDASLLRELTAFAELLLPMGEITPVCETEWQGETVLYAEIVHNTEEGEKCVYELYLDLETGEPRSIRQGERALEIRSFQALP